MSLQPGLREYPTGSKRIAGQYSSGNRMVVAARWP